VSGGTRVLSVRPVGIATMAIRSLSIVLVSDVLGPTVVSTVVGPSVSIPVTSILAGSSRDRVPIVGRSGVVSRVSRSV
jgi:hypothetical protein